MEVIVELYCDNKLVDKKVVNSNDITLTKEKMLDHFNDIALVTGMETKFDKMDGFDDVASDVDIQSSKYWAKLGRDDLNSHVTLFGPIKIYGKKVKHSVLLSEYYKKDEPIKMKSLLQLSKHKKDIDMLKFIYYVMWSLNNDTI